MVLALWAFKQLQPVFPKDIANLIFQKAFSRVDVVKFSAKSNEGVMELKDIILSVVDESFYCDLRRASPLASGKVEKKARSCVVS